MRVEAINNYKIVEDVEQLFAPLNNYAGLQVFLHGSYADNTMTPFSDIDDFVIIDDFELSKADIAVIEEKLAEVEKFFYVIDPLQHHGHWKIYKSELENYNNGVIPLFILNTSKCLIGSSVITASVNHNKTYNTLSGSISGFCKWINVLFESYFHGDINLYNLKRLVGSVVLLAPLIFQLRGLKIDKRQAIMKANELFSLEASKLIQWASDLRLNWGKLLDTQEFFEFEQLQQNGDVVNWRMFAEKNSPVLSSESLSSIVPSKELVSLFLYECVSLLDNCTLINKSNDEYDNAYKLVEEYAISIGATIVGQFGEIKHPGISDLDMLLCFNDVDYKLCQDKIISFIEHNDYFNYVFMHPPVILCNSMLKSFPFVHTINNVKLTFNPNNLKLVSNLTLDYQNKLNILWTIFILPGLKHQAPLANFTGMRDLLLRLKNAHTSIDNLNALVNLPSNYLDKSVSLRNQVFSNYEKCRILINDYINEALTLLSEFGVKKRKRFFVVGRKLIVKEGNYAITTEGSITYYCLPPLLFNVIRAYFMGGDSDIELYLESYKEVEQIALDLNAKVPAVFLFRDYKNIHKPTGVKKNLFKFLSIMPLGILKKIL